MVSSYPHSVPPYNKWRYETPNTVSVENRTRIGIDAPSDLMRTILGAINLLSEVYAWTDKSDLTPEEIVDIVNNEVYIVSWCEGVAECIQTSDGVNDALVDWLQGDDANAEVVRQIIQYQQNPSQSTVQQEAITNDLDYVYGALTDAWEIVLDTWEQISAALAAASTFTSALLEISKLFPSTATAVLTGLDALFTAGPSLTDAWVQAQAQQNAWVCGVFDAVCGRGQPYTLTAADVDAGFAALTGAPIPATVQVLKAATDYTTLINYWRIRSDDTASNDWETLCGCTPSDWCHTFDFAVSNGGWDDVAGRARYLPGTGWTDGNQPGLRDEVRIHLPVGQNVNFTSAEVFYTACSAVEQASIRDFGSAQYESFPITSSPLTASFNLVMDDVRVDALLVDDNPTTACLIITKIVLCGTGTNPFDA